ncbi:MAG: short chain dehydrogenase family protein [Paenibacillus sp.]|jgi:NAD(P)-dependent dehydrogenase (short-subunit alcohol dehydrogenase family)|nr:short chain dehydrogenase family protein [Paenibacillus sp.]
MNVSNVSNGGGKPLAGKVAVVAGATRGGSRGIAVMLGEAGATVYVTGRSVVGKPATEGRTETIEETAAMIDERGGRGIAVRTDHTQEEEVRALFERVEREQDGQLDILVNGIWGGDALSQWETPFWQHSLDNGLLMQRRAVHSHLITSHYGAPLMVKRRQGLIIEVTDGCDYRYRGTLYYSLAKISTIHIAEGMASDLRPYGVTALALTPGFLRSEEVLDYFGVTESNWRDAIAKDMHFAQSETPYYLGRATVALAADPNVSAKSGKALMSGDLAMEYGFTDVDGSQPNWNVYYAKTFGTG